MQKWLRAWLISSTLITSLGSPVVFAKTINVAVVGPLSGPFARFGELQLNAAKLGAQRLSDENLSLKIYSYDDACEPQQAVAMAKKIVKAKINYVIGHVCSGATHPASDVYDEAGIVMITPASTNPDITTRGHTMIFRTIGLDSDQGPTAARYISQHLQPKRVAVVYHRLQYGERIASIVKDELEARGLNVLIYQGVAVDEYDYVALIEHMIEAQVEVVYFAGYHGEMGRLLRQSRHWGLKAQFMGPEGVGHKDIAMIAGAAVDGLLVTLPKRYQHDAHNSELVAQFKAAQLNSNDPFVWSTYAALQAIQQGVMQGRDDPRALAQYLRNNQVSTVMGPLQWDGKGDLLDFDFGVFIWNAQGQARAAKALAPETRE